MTDRFAALTVVLEGDIRSDDAQGLIEAIKHLRGVASVDPVVSDMNTHIARTLARQELTSKLLAVVKDKW
jgi:hypothetical protein